MELTEWPVVVGVTLQYLVVGDEPSDRGHDGYDAEAQERIDGHASAMVDLKFPYDWKGEEKDFPREKSAKKEKKERKKKTIEMARCRKGHTADLGDELKRPIHRYRVDGQEHGTFVHPVVDPIDGRVPSAPESVGKDGRGPAGRGEEYERVQGAAHAQAGAVDEDPVKGEDGKLGKVETRVEEVAGRILKLQF